MPLIGKTIYLLVLPAVFHISHYCLGETHLNAAVVVPFCERPASLGRGVSNWGSLPSFVPGAGKHERGMVMGGLCQPLTIAGSGMDDTGHRELWRPARGSLPSWQGGGQSGSNKLGCQRKLDHMLSLAGKLLVLGLASVLACNAE